jgi:hypothetical protein
MATVVLLGTLDTKGDEYAFLKERIEESGCHVITVNAGVLGDPEYDVDYSRRDVARAAGSDLEIMEEAGDRGTAVTTIAEGAAAVVQRLQTEGRLDGVLGAGGSGGSAIISRAMRSLPVGVPKVLVSTMGAADVRPYVGATDIAMMYSVVDIAGINSISSQILRSVWTGNGEKTGRALPDVGAEPASAEERRGGRGRKRCAGHGDDPELISGESGHERSALHGRRKQNRQAIPRRRGLPDRLGQRRGKGALLGLR